MSDRSLRVALRSLGCKVNLFDQWEVEDGLRKLRRPVTIVPWQASADVYVVNSCTVTAVADRKNRKLVYEVHRREPSASVVVTGCMAQVDQEATAALPGVARVVINDDKHQLPDVIAGLPTRADLEVGVTPSNGRSGHRSRPFLKIQDGCNTHCTYCILPRARGTSRSMDPGEVLERLHALGGSGVSEVVLTGLNMGDYGEDLDPNTDLATLLERIADQRPVERIRLSSIEPRGVSNALIDVVADHPDLFCRHLHLPIQSGSDGILKAMHRPYRRRGFIDLCERIVDRIPMLGLGTDIICGFPGEDEPAFADTLDLVSNAPFSYLHPFPYSPRPGTKAFELDNDVSATTRKARIRQLREVDAERRTRFGDQHVGARFRVTVEGVDEDRGHTIGRTDTYLPVWFEDTAGTSAAGITEVLITDNDCGRLRGTLADR